MRRTMTATLVGVVASLAFVSSALASDCMNASKSDQTAGAQVILNLATGEIVWATPGVASRLDKGLIGADGEGFHGLVGFDFNGDGVVDASTWIGVGPAGTEIAEPALLNGPACRGLTSIFVYFSQCLGV